MQFKTVGEMQVKLEALREHRPPPSGAVACAKTRFNLTFRPYRPERHQNLITCSLSPLVIIGAEVKHQKFDKK